METESGALVVGQSVVADDSEAVASTVGERKHGEGMPPSGCTLAAQSA